MTEQISSLVELALSDLFDGGKSESHVAGSPGHVAHAWRRGAEEASVNVQDGGGLRMVGPAELPEGYDYNCPTLPTVWIFGSFDSADPKDHPQSMVRRVS